SVSGSWAYLLVVIATGLMTDYPRRFPHLFGMVAGAMVVVIAARLLLFKALKTGFAHRPEVWRFRLRAAILATPLVWGFFQAATTHLYQREWTCALVVILTSGMAAGATTAFSPDLALHRNFQLLLWTPTIVVNALGLGSGYALAGLACLFTGYLLWQGREHSRQYWRSVKTRQRLARQTAELESHQRIKDEFLAVITHDLRNSLQSVLLFTSTLKHRTQDPVVREMGDHMRETGTYMKELLDDLHDLARLGMKALKMKAEEVNLVAIVERVLAEQNEPAGEGRIHLRLSSPERELSLMADEVRLRQILANLISNAIKYNRPGGWVEVRTRVEGEQVVVEVEDSGIGIQPEDHDRVFELFSRVDGATVEGSGLGLAITRQLVELHEGSLELESQPDKGSVFRVRLPRSGPAALAC
ncbi:MAG: HAMP domain-containing histidine kinase, partial [Candidatus Eremiobacteraeota bacterium]|nr:HAMP domain-containing histidine kinase [Candidatus Eremiobacteraeota bacterium]